MRSFKTSARHIITQGLLLVCLLVFTFQTENVQSLLRMPILLIVDVIVLVFFLSSFMRKITITEDNITVKSIWKTATVDIKKLEYVQVLSAFGRLVMILNDGSRTVIITSLVDGFYNVAESVKQNLPENLTGKLDSITPVAVGSKKLVYDSIMIMLSLIVAYGILRDAIL